jgi:D-alanyl-D-alanine carboxypeptidase
MLDLILAFTLAFSNPADFESIPSPTQPTEQLVRLESTRPIVNAKAAIVVDLDSGTILYKKNDTDQLPIASLTKIMTALIIIQEHDLQEIVTVPGEATQIGGSTMYLSTNEQISVENLLKGLLMQSGNDAATTLAIYNSGSVDAFVQKMNNKAQEMNLKDTSFQNPMGFDNPNNYSTVRDLLILSKELYKNETIQEIVATPTDRVTSADQRLTHTLISTNALLDGYLDIVGLKTGSTDQALGCFVGITNSEHPQISIVLGSPNRFHDTKILLDWSQKTFTYK